MPSRKHIHSLALILLIAACVRLGLSWHEGYGFDIGVYQGWARSGVELGMAESYTMQVGGNMLPDYPPLAIAIFTGLGHMYRFLFGAFDLSALSFRIFIKFPAIIADLTICWMLYASLKKYKGERAAILGSTAYALNPAALYDTAIWGQTDAVYTAFLLGAILAWLSSRRDLSAILLACSVLFKLQSIVLFPLFALLASRNLRTLLRFSIVGILTATAILLPFAIGGVLQEVSDVYLGAVGRYGNVTIGAYNFWWALLGDKGWQIVSTESPFGMFSYTQWGTLLFGLCAAYILFIAHRALQRGNPFESLLYCSALLSIAFFLFLTQMHERYLFPFVALGIPLLFVSKRTAMAYWVVSIAFTVNLMGILPLSIIDRTLYRVFDTLDVFVACTIVWMFIDLLLAAHQRYVDADSTVRGSSR